MWRDSPRIDLSKKTRGYDVGWKRAINNRIDQHSSKCAEVTGAFGGGWNVSRYIVPAAKIHGAAELLIGPRRKWQALNHRQIGQRYGADNKRVARAIWRGPIGDGSERDKPSRVSSANCGR